MITEHHNYDDGYVGLPNLQIGVLPERITVEGDELVMKDEFHISLLGIKRIAPMIRPDNEDEGRRELLDKFNQIVKDVPLNKYEILPELRVVQRGDRKTLVVMAKVPGIEELFDRLRSTYPNIDIPTQQTHITLYTLPESMAIGLISAEDVEKLSHKVQVLEVEKALIFR